VKFYQNNLGLSRHVLVDLQVEMYSPIYMLLFSVRLVNFWHAEPYEKNIS
jgi:hypothetical protein